jgi:hypothetical protein
LGGWTKKDEMGGDCGTKGGEGKAMRTGFWLGNVEVNGRIILKCIGKK